MEGLKVSVSPNREERHKTHKWGLDCLWLRVGVLHSWKTKNQAGYLNSERSISTGKAGARRVWERLWKYNESDFSWSCPSLPHLLILILTKCSMIFLLHLVVSEQNGACHQCHHVPGAGTAHWDTLVSPKAAGTSLSSPAFNTNWANLSCHIWEVTEPAFRANYNQPKGRI